MGGSITYNGTYANYVATWLRGEYLFHDITMNNAGVSATGSTYGLIRLQADVVDVAPEMVILDFTVNDTDTAYSKAAAEALIRRLRTDLPDAKLVAIFFLTVADPLVDDPTNVTAAVLANWQALCELYSIPYADFAAHVAANVPVPNPLSYYLGDIVHPTTNGHIAAAGLLEGVIPALFEGAQVSPPLPARIYDNGDYENDPIIRNGIDNDGETGTGWTTSSDGTSRESSTADDTITYTGTFQMIIRDFQIGSGNGVVAWQIDGGSWTNLDLAADGSNYRTHWIGTRAEHTIVFKVVSGRVKLRRFLAI